MLYTVTTVYIPTQGAMVVHSWGPYGTRSDAINAASRMRRRHKRENGDFPRGGKLTIHVTAVTDPFEVKERHDDGPWIITQSDPRVVKL